MQVAAQDKSLRVLLVIQTMEGRPGASMYVNDFAKELLLQGHRPMVFSPRLGPLAEELRNFSVPVADRLDQVTTQPDIIHGNSPIETAAALLHFLQTPAIFVCHGWDSPDALPPKMPRIVNYVAVDETCFDRLTCREGIPVERVLVHFNPVDLKRFVARPGLPEKPRRALVYSNYASEDNYLPAIRSACERFDIELDVIGQGAGSLSAHPERILGTYDIVFAKGRCALEAIAVGSAVILCDTSGLGRMVTKENWRTLRSMNFGFRALRNAINSDDTAAEICKYNAEDAMEVSRAARAQEGLEEATRSLVEIYRNAIQTHSTAHVFDNTAELKATAAFLETIAPYSNTFHVAEKLREADRQVKEAQRYLRTASKLAPMPPLSEQQAQKVVVVDAAAPQIARAGKRFSAMIEISNESDHYIAGHTPSPVHLSYRWIDADTRTVCVADGDRTQLDPPLQSGEKQRYFMHINPPDEAGRYVLRVTLVQELVRWFDVHESGYREFTVDVM